MTKEAFERIKEGLEEAIEMARDQKPKSLIVVGEAIKAAEKTKLALLSRPQKNSTLLKLSLLEKIITRLSGIRELAGDRAVMYLKTEEISLFKASLREPHPGTKRQPGAMPKGDM